jgi:DNA invertase Pin-like site-specific DNA recombinase
MLRVRLVGTKNDIKWFGKIWRLQKNGFTSIRHFIDDDVVEVGLLKRTFDEYHVRFIAANDNLDTANGFDIMSIFRDVINEWYVADTSRKIKAVFKSRMEKGLRCSGSVCYSYRASKEEKGE